MKRLILRWSGNIILAAFILLSPAISQAQTKYAGFVLDKDLKLQLVDMEKIPRHGTFWSVQRNFPPTPCYAPFLRELNTPVYQVVGKSGVYLVDDSKVDYVSIYKQRAEDKLVRKLEWELGLMSNEEYFALEGVGGGGMALRSYTVDELWLEITPNTNVNFVNLTLHNTRSNLFYQIHSALDLAKIDWIPGEIFTNTAGLTNITFAPVAITNSPKMFFRGVASDTMVSITRLQDVFEPNYTNGMYGEYGQFTITRTTISGDISQSLDIPIGISGTASNGVDYLDAFTAGALSSVQTISGSLDFQPIFLDPQEDNVIELDETVTLRIVVTNTYVIDPSNYQATITISDPPEYLFTTVAMFETTPSGIDYYAPSNSLLVALGTYSYFNFVRIDTNGFATNWSDIQYLNDELMIAVAPSTANGFTNGAMYFGSGANVGVLSASGTRSNMTWVTLTNSFGTNETLLRGSLHIDQSGSFGGKLLVVSGGSESQGGGVWSITATGGVTAIATIPDTHLEGLTSLTNDPAKWGPWAGKLITGAESAIPPAIYAISPAGIVVTNYLDIQPEDFDVIPTNQNLYCMGMNGQTVVKVSSNIFTNFVGDLLVTQEGFIDQPLVPNNHLPKLFILHWDGTNIVKRASISRRSWEFFEHATFAPINIPAL